MRQVLEPDGLPSYIQTIPKRGYKWIAPVKLEQAVSVAKPSDVSDRKSFNLRFLWIPGVLTLFVVALLYLLYRPAFVPTGTHPPASIRPITSDGQRKYFPQLSPDGKQVLYFASGDIFLKPTGAGTTPQRLTHHPGPERFAVWSPDGKQFAFLRWNDQKAAIYTIPAPFGGLEPKVAEVNLGGALSWSPDGHWLAKSEQLHEDEPSRIVLISPQSGEKRPLTNPPGLPWNDQVPAFSSDGTQMAFARTERGQSADLWIQPIDGNEARRLTYERYLRILAPAWTLDGQELVFAADSLDFFVGTPTRLYRVTVAGGRPKLVAGVGPGVGGLYPRRSTGVCPMGSGSIANLAHPGSKLKGNAGPGANHPKESEVCR